MRNVDIFGTCLTRELFNTTEEYAVNNYLMQQSIFTLFSKPLYVDKSEIKSHDNYNFKNRMLYYELNKIALDNLLKNHTKYLVIDLADVGRIIMFKECLRNNIMPFIVLDNDKSYYIRGLKEYETDKMLLIDTIKHEQDLYEKMCEELLDFKIEENN